MKLFKVAMTQHSSSFLVVLFYFRNALKSGNGDLFEPNKFHTMQLQSIAVLYYQFQIWYKCHNWDANDADSKFSIWSISLITVVDKRFIPQQEIITRNNCGRKSCFTLGRSFPVIWTIIFNITYKISIQQQHLVHWNSHN